MAGMPRSACIDSSAGTAETDVVTPHLVSVPLNPDNDPSQWRQARHRVEIVVRDGRVDVCLHGDIDAAAAQQLTRDLEPLGTISAAIYVDLSHVALLDSNGVEPVVELARSHAVRGLPLVQVSAEVVMSVGDPELIVSAGHQLLKRPVRSKTIEHRLHLTPSPGHADRRRQ